MSFFEAISIDKTYGGQKALNNVTIHVPEGSIYGLLGPNGAGKTTLIRIINQITAPDAGELKLMGKKFAKEDLAMVGYLPEERGLYKKMKVGEQVLYLAQLKGLGKKDAMTKLRYWFEKFEMVGWWDKKVEELSKGMAQKVQFVVTVLHEPKLLIFDEPFSGFDPVNANMLKQEVIELKDKGATIIFSTHDMASVEELCDYITLIDKSKTILEGNVHDIKQKFKSNSYLIEFEGNPEDFQNSMHDNFEINSITSLPYNQYSALIKLSGKGKSNDLLRAATGSVSINTFRELLPSMNEIFIRAISENSIPVTHE